MAAAPRKVVQAHQASEHRRVRVPSSPPLHGGRTRGVWGKSTSPPPTAAEKRLQSKVAELQAKLEASLADPVPENGGAILPSAPATPPNELRNRIAMLEKQIKSRGKEGAFERELNAKDEEHIEDLRLQLSAVQSPQALHSAASQDFNKKQAALKRISETLEAKESALSKLQAAISLLREQQAQAQAELRASQQKLSAVSFAVTGGPAAIPKLDERFAAEQPDLQKWLADPCFKLWQEALSKQAAAEEEARRTQAAEEAKKASDAADALAANASGAGGGGLPAAGGGAGLAESDPLIDETFMELDEELVENLRTAASSSDKRALTDFLEQQGVGKKQRQG